MRKEVYSVPVPPLFEEPGFIWLHMGGVQKPQSRKLSVKGVPPLPPGLQGRDFPEKLAEISRQYVAEK